MPPQRFLDLLNPRLPIARLKPAVRLTGVPYVSRAMLAGVGQLVGRSPHYISVYHRYSSFFYPPEVCNRVEQKKELRKRESQPMHVTSTINTRSGSFSSNNNATLTTMSNAHFDIKSRDAERAGRLQHLRRDAASYARLFPFTDCVDGCARGRACIGLSKIHLRGVFATSFIPKGGVALCVKKLDLLDPIATHLLMHSPRALPTLWRFYSCHGGAAFPVPLTPNPTHFLNHSCSANLRAGFFYMQEEEEVVVAAGHDDAVGKSALSAQPPRPLPASCFVSDPRPWLECAAKYGEANADADCEAPILRSLSNEEIYDFNNCDKSSSSQAAAEQPELASDTDTTTSVKKKKTIKVDWNCFVAQRDIEPGEELTMDYARHIAPGYAGEFTSMAVSVASPCNCGSPHCSGDMYRSVPTRLDVVPSHELRMAAAAPYFAASDARANGNNNSKNNSKNGEKTLGAAQDVDTDADDQQDLSILLRSRRADPHDDDLVRCSFLQNREEFIDRFHRTLPKTLLWKSDVVTNSIATCEFLTAVLSRSKEAPLLPGRSLKDVSPMDLH